MSAFFLGRFIRLALSPPASHGTDGRTDCCPTARIARYCAYRGSAGGAPARPSQPPTLGLLSLSCSLLFGCTHIGCGGRLRARSFRVYSRLLLYGVVAFRLVDQLLVVSLIRFGIDKHPNLLSCRK